MKIALVLAAAVLMNLPWLAHAQGPPGPYPGPPPGPGYPSQGYPSQGYPSQGYPSQGYPSPGYPSPGYPSPGYPPPGYAEAQWAQCQQLAQAEQEITGRLQFTPPSPERAAMEQQLREIGAARQTCWPR